MLHARERVLAFHDHVRLVEARRAAPALVGELVTDVGARDGAQRRQVGEVAGERLARVDERRVRSQRFLERRHREQLRVLDLDQVERLRRGQLVGGRHRGHRLALVASDVHGHERAIAERRPVVRIAPGQIASDDDAVHAGQRAGTSVIDSHDPGMGVR
ncbi:MAG TPA: hypothetical protein VGJ70_04435, partial [Solirubrobacteraceae bacterium]